MNTVGREIFVGRKVYKDDYATQGTVKAINGGWIQVSWNDGTTVWQTRNQISAPTS